MLAVLIKGTFTLRSHNGRYYRNDLSDVIVDKLIIPSPFFAPAFRNGWEDRNIVGWTLNTADDRSKPTSSKSW